MCRSCAPAICWSSPASSASTPTASSWPRASSAAPSRSRTARRPRAPARSTCWPSSRAALGDLDKVARVVRLGGFINSAPGFLGWPEGDEWRLRPDGRRLSATRAAMPAPPSASQRCRSTPRSRSRPVRSRLSTVRRMRDWLTARPIAHRGLHDAAAGVIENTPSAFPAAIAGGYGIECDLQISADGEAMVHHDYALGRLTDGAGRLDAMTAADAQAHRVQGHRRPHDDARRSVRPRCRAVRRW